jgi:outer membrane PBP1 activator LpoA protein
MIPADHAVVPLAAAVAGPRLTRRQRDFLLLNIFVLLRHGYVERARVLAEALYRLGDDSVNVHLARAVLRFAAGDWQEALDVLERLDHVSPIERFGSYRLNEQQRARRYIKMKCFSEMGDQLRTRDALEAYLRHGEEGTDLTE